MDRVAQGLVAPGQVRGEEHGRAGRVDEAGGTDADRRDVVTAGQLGHQVDDGVLDHPRALAAVRRLAPAALEDPPVDVDDTPGDLGPADVDPDRRPAQPGRQRPQRLGVPLRTSLGAAALARFHPAFERALLTLAHQPTESEPGRRRTRRCAGPAPVDGARPAPSPWAAGRRPRQRASSAPRPGARRPPAARRAAGPPPGRSGSRCSPGRAAARLDESACAAASVHRLLALGRPLAEGAEQPGRLLGEAAGRRLRVSLRRDSQRPPQVGVGLEPDAQACRRARPRPPPCTGAARSAARAPAGDRRPAARARRRGAPGRPREAWVRGRSRTRTNSSPERSTRIGSGSVGRRPRLVGARPARP